VHIDPRTGALSSFLSGTRVVDPKDSSIVHSFAELEHRREALDVLINKGCPAGALHSMGRRRVWR
jgi:hypothetical protein